MAHVDSSLTPKQQRAKNIRKIWMVAGILAVVTAIEYIIAFSIPYEFKFARNTIFIVLTLVKAAYIIAEFMHLKHEVKVLIYSILVPIVFVCWLLLAMYLESSFIFEDRFPSLLGG